MQVTLCLINMLLCLLDDYMLNSSLLKTATPSIMQVVPPNQAEIMHDKLKGQGVATGLVMFDGEQHGFRQDINIRYVRCCCVQPATVFKLLLLVLGSGALITHLSKRRKCRLECRLASQQHIANPVSCLRGQVTMFNTIKAELQSCHLGTAHRTALDGEMYFYSQVLKFPFSLPADIPAFEIANLDA